MVRGEQCPLFDEENRLGEINTALWWIGWNPLVVAVTGVLLSVVGRTPLLLVGGVAMWFVGLLYVNATYESVKDDYVELVHRRRLTYTSNTDPEANVHTLVGGTASSRWYSPPEAYNSNHLIIGPSSATILRGIKIDVATRMPTVRDDRREVFYDQISSVTYSQPYLIIKTADGDTLRYVSGRKPTDALQELQKSVREYKERSRAS